jgi:putative redox protein
MVEIRGSYVHPLKMEITHAPSGTVIPTSAPRDNNGDGSSFSPTDLVAAALGSCMVTVMGIVARREGIPFDDVSFRVEKHMRAEPRRIDRLPVTLRMPRGLTGEQRGRLEAAALGCPVHLSLLPEIERDVHFQYPEEESSRVA